MCVDTRAACRHQDVVTGETLCDEKAPVILERMDFPDPVIKIAIEPKSKADLEKLGMGLNKLAQEDPSFGYSRWVGDRVVRPRGVGLVGGWLENAGQLTSRSNRGA